MFVLLLGLVLVLVLVLRFVLVLVLVLLWQTITCSSFRCGAPEQVETEQGYHRQSAIADSEKRNSMCSKVSDFCSLYDGRCMNAPSNVAVVDAALRVVRRAGFGRDSCSTQQS